MKENIAKIQQDPEEAFEFFSEKNLAQWCDPMFQSVFVAVPDHTDARETRYPELMKSIYTAGIADDVISVFSKYIGMNADGYAPGEAGEEVVAVLTSVYVDGSAAQLVLQPRDESTFYMLVDGKTDFYMNASELETLLYRINSVKNAQ